MAERIPEQRLREFHRLNCPEWAEQKLPKRLLSDLRQWNDQLPSLDRESRASVLRARLELQGLLSQLVPLARQWSETALASTLSRMEESREYALPRGVVEPAQERLYDRSLQVRVNADPLVRIARAHENEARRFSSDLAGLSGFNSAAIEQLQGSRDQEPGGWYRPNASTPLFASGTRDRSREAEPAEQLGQTPAEVSPGHAGQYSESFDTAAEPL